MKEGEYVTCINIQSLKGSDAQYHNLKKYKYYKIIEVSEKSTIQIRDENDELNWYYQWRFKTIKEIRKEKLNKIFEQNIS